MEEYLKEALEIVKAQASVRNMTEEEMSAMILALSRGIRETAREMPGAASQSAAPGVDPARAIREKSILCLECGKSFRVLTKKHLGKHGMTPEEYKAKWGYKKNTSLVARSLTRNRRKRMQEMQLWKKRQAQA
ncbi:transcriptional regulator, MucR family [Desulfonatronospira thiodismutans ASO3-1]|uniref:Transcriptional regulator, MucR family n=1 Tax=Desulfonatronospira thiodismutans ASO3-1 TaxID=555779 RepID=D6STL5_9BACT|nr:MucR family transcriptional regulator [Desulfonatronospira thiodismutans]EFI34031.1 transcriptional regulator, MucR family [Desulfonatronospira thiodismutans ASO3-1]